MKKLLSYVVLALVVASVTVVAVREYDNRPQKLEQATVSQKVYNDAVMTRLSHDAVNKVKVDQLTTQIQSQDAKLASTCAQLKLLKAVNAACTQ